MSETNISDYYPQNPEEEKSTNLPGFDAPPQLAAGEPATKPLEIEDLGIDLPDIPLPDNEAIEDSVKDEFDDAAFNFAVVGVGQGGSRIAETFWNLGYRRVGIINTARQDL